MGSTVPHVPNHTYSQIPVMSIGRFQVKLCWIDYRRYFSDFSSMMGEARQNAASSLSLQVDVAWYEKARKMLQKK